MQTVPQGVKGRSSLDKHCGGIAGYIDELALWARRPLPIRAPSTTRKDEDHGRTAA